MRAVDQQVVAAAGKPTAAGLYVISRQPDRVMYVWGNRFEQAWQVIVKADATDTGSLVTLTVPKWLERDGLLASHDVLARLRSQIQAAAGGGADAGLNAAAPSDPAAADFTPSEGTAWKTPLKNLLLLGMVLLVTRGAYLVLLDGYQSVGERLGNLILYVGGAAACYLIASRIHTYRGDAVGETAGPTEQPSRTAHAIERFSLLSGKARALLVLGLLAAVLVAGLVVSNYNSAGSSSDRHLASVDVNNPGGTGGDYTPPSDTASAGDNASSTDANASDETPAENADDSSAGNDAGQDGASANEHHVLLPELLALAPADGSQVTLHTFWDASNSVSGQRLAFTTDDPQHKDWLYLVKIDEMTRCQDGDKSISAGELIDQAFGMYHNGTVTFTNKRLIELRVVNEDQ